MIVRRGKAMFNGTPLVAGVLLGSVPGPMIISFPVSVLKISDVERSGILDFPSRLEFTIDD